jgi:hypothetical protein
LLVSRFPDRSNPTRRAIGSYPAITIEKARTTTRGWLDLIERGIDPAVQVASEVETNRQRQSNTFGAVAASSSKSMSVPAELRSRSPDLTDGGRYGSPCSRSD